MTVLDVAKDVCAEVGLDIPTALFGQTDRDWVELASHFNKARREIQQAYEWSAKKVYGKIVGDGISSLFSVPDDFDRMVVGGSLWSSRLHTPLTHVEDQEAWLHYNVSGQTFLINAWTLRDTAIELLPIPATGEELFFQYVTKWTVRDSAGELKEGFTADTDVFQLDTDLLELNVTYRWKKAKGLAYAEWMNDYHRLKEKRIVADKGASVIKLVGRAPMLDAQVAFGAISDTDSVAAAASNSDYVTLFNSAIAAA